MGVVFQSFDHHEAIQKKTSLEETSRNDMECWSHELQPTVATPTLAVVTCPLLSLRTCVDKRISVCWMAESSKRCQRNVSDEKAHHMPLKRACSVVVSPSRRAKRQRISANPSDVSRRCKTDHKDKKMVVGSPRSLQYALPGLSSHDTQYVLHAMRVLPSELRYLNGNASRSRLRQRCKVRQVLGWRHVLCHEEEDEESARRVVWKSAKALNAVKMRPLARQIWNASTMAASGIKNDDERGKVLYTINHICRVVYSTKQRYGNPSRTPTKVWIECFLDDGLQICVARKELRQFGEYQVPQVSVTECQGYLVRPLYTRSINAHLVGCSLQCLRAVAARDCGVWSVPALKQQMINDLPMLTQQCEEECIHDLVQHHKYS